MKTSRYRDPLILSILRQPGGGVPGAAFRWPSCAVNTA